MRKLLLFLFSAILSAQAWGASGDLTKEQMAECEKALSFVIEGTSLATLGTKADLQETSSIILETRPFSDLFDANPEKNLFKQAPQLLMSAPQRMLSMVLQPGVEKRKIGYLGGRPIPYYPFFSSGTAATKGARVVGQIQSIADMMSALFTQARGDRSGAKIPLFWGPHGTGKSEIIDVFKSGAVNLSTNNPEYFYYSFSFKNLTEIEELKLLVQGRDKLLIHAPLDDSPLTLLPETVQQEILAQNSEAVKEKLKGIDPSPILKPDPMSEKIVRLLYQHYGRLLGRPLTVKEQLGVLAKHTELRRVVLGATSGSMPIIDVQGQDIDTNSLFMSPNPVVRALSQEGPSDIFSWFLNGKVFKGHGSAILFDEYFRNPGEFRDMLLRAFQSRVMSIGGAPDVSFDSFIIAATNTANLVDISSDAKGKAAVDRMKKIPMRWSVIPNEIVRTLIYMNRSSLYVQDLKPAEGTDPQWVLANNDLDKIVPIAESLSVGGVQSTDYRYRVQYGIGSNAIAISPLTLKYIAWVVASTRFETNQAKAVSKINGELQRILGSQIFRDETTRLKVFEGEQHIKPSELQDLNRAASILEEGDNGISARDAGLWLNEIINEARGRHNTATPELAVQVLNRMLDNKQIESGTDKEREKWRGLARTVAARILVPKLEGDVSKALSSQQRTVGAAYWEVLDMLIELDRDPSAKIYTSRRSGNAEKTIDSDLLKFVMTWFQEKDGIPLLTSTIAMFHTRTAGTPEAEVPHPDLLAAITAYYAQVATRAVNIAELAEVAATGDGSTEAKDMLASVLSNLHDLGYNEIAARQALSIIRSYRAGVQQVRQ